MLLIPYGIENRVVRRFPWVTLGLVFFNLVAFLITGAVERSRATEVEVLASLIQETLETRAYLTLPEQLRQSLGAEATERLLREHAWRAHQGPIPSDGRLKKEQRDLDLLVGDYLTSLNRLPSRLFGFTPAKPRLWSVFTAMFIHAGWLHLLGNMLFLYLAGSHIENVYGHALYPVCYLLSGVSATLGHFLADTGSAVPLVGASGAIAGIMGVLLVRLLKARIRFLLLPFVIPIARIHLSLPAFVVLPFWLLQQFLGAQEASAQTDVAWWAHIAGFIFGCALAGAVALLRLEQRWSDPTPQARTARLLQDVADARMSGDYEKARQELRSILMADPDNVDAWHEAHELALAIGDGAEITRATTRFLDLLAQANDAAEAERLIADPRWTAFPELMPRILLSFAAFRERCGDLAAAIEHCGEVVRCAPNDPLAIRALVRQAELLIRVERPSDARRLLERARLHPACDGTWDDLIARTLARLDRLA